MYRLGTGKELGFDFVWPTLSQERCAWMVSECLRWPRLSGSDGVLGVRICPQETNSSLSRDVGTCSHEKINFPRPDSEGKVTRVVLGSLEEGGGFCEQGLVLF